MTDTDLAHDLTDERERLKESVRLSFTARDFRAGIAPLCRLLLQLEPRNPERAVLLAMLAIAHAKSGRSGDAERDFQNARRVAADPRGRAAVRLVGETLGLWRPLEVVRS